MLVRGLRRWVALLAAASCWSAWPEAASPPAPFLLLSAGGNAVHSNAIKVPAPGSSVASVSASPGGKQQILMCAEDEDCNAEEFCPNSARGGVHGTPACLACRKRRKRCYRDAMCCPGNYCYNGMCVPLEHGNVHHGEIEDNIMEHFNHGASDSFPKKTTSSSRLHHFKGQEGTVCLRSSDCAEDLCCARHFWSKICKPVLKEGQVCTKHRKKGAHGLEIFQRCNCGDGLTCRVQRDHTSSNSSRLHTCQRH